MPAKKSRLSKKASSNAKGKSGGGRMAGSERAGIIFPPGRCTRLIRQCQPIDRVSYKAGVHIAAALELLTAELLEQVGDIAKEKGLKRIKPRHIILSLEQDTMMKELWDGAIVASGGVVPHIEPFVEEKRSKGRKKKANVDS